MSLLSAIIIGIIVGAVAGTIIQDNFDLLVLNLCMGIVGAVAGDALYFLVRDSSYFTFTIGGLVFQTTGALLFVLLFSLLNKAMSRKEHIDTINQ